jgi:hypothetical protein
MAMEAVTLFNNLDYYRTASDKSRSGGWNECRETVMANLAPNPFG